MVYEMCPVDVYIVQSGSRKVGYGVYIERGQDFL